VALNFWKRAAEGREEGVYLAVDEEGGCRIHCRT
jgi:hypothetical protein